MKPVAFYLPQFYPTPENNRWWGEGFTEWTNVTKSKPKYKGHYQPQLPADLGFYDLRVPETIMKQVEIARNHNLYGFCFYHYWFNGERPLNKPVDLFIETEKEFPFCVCWANHDWNKIWDGFPNTILMKQNHSIEDDTKHIRFLAEHVFSSPNYIKVDNKPVFLVYRTELFPDIKKTSDVWRREILNYGFDGIYLINIENIVYDVHPDRLGFDAGLDFHPKGKNLPKLVGRNIIKKWLNRFSPKKSVYYENKIWEYEDYIDNNIIDKDVSYLLYPALFPAWDNSARREKEAWIMQNSTPEKFRKWASLILENFEPPNEEENFVFINAWNEWAEGCHLEPCRKWKNDYLNVIKELF